MSLLELLSGTNAYKTILSDTKKSTLSHAYLVSCADQQNLTTYLKELAKLMVCQYGKGCMDRCRNCSLIEANAHPDVILYPKKEGNILTQDVADIIAESHIKPLECDKKIFILSNAQTLNLPSQNKLLKTLEEPPKNVIIILGATSEYPLLQTVKSRLKKLEIPAFSNEQLFDALKEEFFDERKLKRAIACGDGTVGKAVQLYGDEKLAEISALAVDTLINMKSSANVLDYTQEILTTSPNEEEFLSVLEVLLRDVLLILNGKGDACGSSDAFKVVKEGVNFSVGAVIHAIDCVHKAFEKKKFNANSTMLIEWVLFQILEGKYKWQKL